MSGKGESASEAHRGSGGSTQPEADAQPMVFVASVYEATEERLP